MYKNKKQWSNTSSGAGLDSIQQSSMGFFFFSFIPTTETQNKRIWPNHHISPTWISLKYVISLPELSFGGPGRGYNLTIKPSTLYLANLLPSPPTTFIFRGYDPNIEGPKPSFFMILGSKGSGFSSKWLTVLGKDGQRSDLTVETGSKFRIVQR